MKKNISFTNGVASSGAMGSYLRKSAFFLLALAIFGFTGCSNDDDNDVVTPQGVVITEADDEFATKAAQWNRAQIEFGELALQKSSNDEVKAFAQEMIDTYTAAQQELANTLATKGINFADNLEDDDQEKLDHLSKQGEDFDEKYLDDQEMRLKKMEVSYDAFEDNGDDADLKTYADKYLPTIENDIDQADDLEEKVD